MVDRACYSFKLSAWNELAGVDDFYSLFYYIRNDGVPEIEIFSTLVPNIKHSPVATSRFYTTTLQT